MNIFTYLLCVCDELSHADRGCPDIFWVLSWVLSCLLSNCTGLETLCAACLRSCRREHSEGLDWTSRWWGRRDGDSEHPRSECQRGQDTLRDGGEEIGSQESTRKWETETGVDKVSKDLDSLVPTSVLYWLMSTTLTEGGPLCLENPIRDKILRDSQRQA